MAVPNLRRALRGWVKTTTVEIVTKAVVNFRTVETTSTITKKMNFQPSPPEVVDRKPPEQRSWKWWSIIIQDSAILLKTDDIVIDSESRRFRVQKAYDWRSSGFSKYEVIEDYVSST